MTRSNRFDRRTVLRTLGGGLVAGGLLAGRAGGRPGRPADGVVTVTAGHDHGTGEHAFDVSDTELRSGWTTFRLDNATGHTHFAYLARLPQVAIDEAGGRDLLAFYIEEVTEPFQGFMDFLLGETPRHDPTLPAWFAEVRPSGGPGFVSGGETGVTTVALEPGEYILECYVKEPNDPYRDFHSYNGMIEHLTVADGGSATPEPTPTLEVTIDNDGISAPEVVRSGAHTVGVTFEEQQFYDHLLGHDVHLVRLDDGADLDAVNDWMNWMAPDGLLSDGDDPERFLGGVQTILTPALLDGSGSETGYVHVRLDPGEYAWVSEVPDPAGKDLLVPFTVPTRRATGRGDPAGRGSRRDGRRRGRGR